MDDAQGWSIEARRRTLREQAGRALVPEPPFPKNVMIELSNACNHACVFCANPKMTRRRRVMDRALVGSVMEQARRLGAEELGFYTTGDPFVHPELERFVAQAKRLGYPYTYISTNGALATPERSKAVIDAGLDSIKFSINAGSRETYRAIHGRDEFDQVLEHLRVIAQYRRTLTRKLRLAVSFVVTAQNQHEAAPLRERLLGLVDDVCLYDVDNQQGYMQENESFIAPDTMATPVQAPCYMVFGRAHVTCEGYLTLCCVDYQNYLAVADLTRVSLAEAWRHPRFVAMRRRHLENKLEGTLCWNCIHGRQSAIEPLAPELATSFAFTEAAAANRQRQARRFAQAPAPPVEAPGAR